MSWDPINDELTPGDDLVFPNSITLGTYSNTYADIYLDDYRIRYTETDGFREYQPDLLNPLKRFWDWITQPNAEPATKAEARERAIEEQRKADLYQSIMDAANSARKGETIQDGAFGAAFTATAAGLKSMHHSREAQRYRDLEQTLPN